MTKINFSILSLIIASVFANNAVASEDELKAQIEKLKTQINALQDEVKNLEKATEAVAHQQEKQQQEQQNNSPTEKKSADTGATLWGYGEINYNRPTHSTQDTQMDLRRAVFGIGYKFNEQTRLVTEYEVEHAVASSGDQGEVEVEQFYVDHQISKSTHLKAGLFLIPAGLLNESHEPTQYYGVERNQVETAIIPSTWREGGVALFGSTESGLAWDAGLTTTVSLSHWDANSEEGKESPLGSIHQELQLANAADLGTYLALNYRGIPGFTIGGSLFTSKISQDNPDLAVAKNARMTLWDVHSRWTNQEWDLSAVYARGNFSGTQALNVTFAGMPTPVPKTFFGGYVQAAYHLWQDGNYSLTPFVRYESVNTAASFEAMPQGLENFADETQHTSTLGVSFFLNPHVVVKWDFQSVENNSSKDKMNLGLGVSF